MVRARSLAALLFFALMLVSPSSASAWPGDLDPGFGTDGVRVSPFPQVTGTRDADMQPDGKVVSAISRQASETCRIARFNADGSVDGGFGVAGVASFTYGTFCASHDVAVAPSGRIYALGQGQSISGADDTPVLFAFTPAGALDAAVLVAAPTLASGTVRPAGLAIADDGKILIAGTTEAGSSVIARFSATGSLDFSFNSTGSLTIPNASVGGLIARPGGVVIAYGDTSAATPTRPAAWRVTSGGALDATFGNGGKASLQTGPDIGSASTAIALADGGLLLGGHGYVSATGNAEEGQLVRFDASGNVVSGFGSGGVARIRLGHSEYVNSLAQQADGRVVVGGQQSPIYGQLGEPEKDLSLIARFNPDGTPDATFSAGGGAGGGILLRALGDDDDIHSIFLRPDGRILALYSTLFNGVGQLGFAQFIGGNPVALTAKIKSPSKSKLRAKKFKKISGTAGGDGLTKVEIALVRIDSKLLKKHKRCLQLSSPKAKFKKVKAVKKRCVPSKWLAAKGTSYWSYSLKKTLPRGKYTIYVRSRGVAGLQVKPAKKTLTLTK